MAHELSFIDNQAEFAFLQSQGDAWHGFGQAIEDATANDLNIWLDKSNMGNWEIIARPVVDIIDNVIHEIPNRVSLRRSDNNAALNIVSPDFKVVQPREVVEFFDSIIKSLGFTMSTCGVLHSGKRYWAQADTPHGFEINGDKVNTKLFLATGNDGISTTARWTQTRVVCNNTWQAATSNSQNAIKITHRQEFKPAELQAQLGIPRVEEVAAICENMSRTRFTETQAMDYLSRVFDIKVEEIDDMTPLEAQEERLALTAQSSNAMNCFHLFNGEGKGAELAPAHETLWGAFNSVTEYADHHRNTRTWDARFDSAQFGTWNNIKNRAWDEAIQLVA